MKALLATLTLTFTVFSAQATSLILGEAYIQKNSNHPQGITYKAQDSLKSWCTGLGSQISFGAFEAAEKVDAMAEGLFRCEGKFVQVPGSRQNPIQIFSISGCTELNPVDLKTECPPIK